MLPARHANTLGKTGWCLEIHDLLISKYVAGREKDLRFSAAAARHGLADCATLLDRLDATELAPALRDTVRDRIERDFSR